jgi:hypothetical protein
MKNTLGEIRRKFNRVRVGGKANVESWPIIAPRANKNIVPTRPMLTPHNP